MADKPTSLQDLFLNALRRSKTPVTMFLVKGVKLQGIVTWFDNFSVLLRRDGQSQLIYKHAISTIVPARSVRLPNGDGDDTQPADVCSSDLPPPYATADQTAAGAQAKPQKTVLVHLEFSGTDFDADRAEFIELARSAGLDVVGVIGGKRDRPDAGTYAGS
eukprot:gene15153-19354_t